MKKNNHNYTILILSAIFLLVLNLVTEFLAIFPSNSLLIIKSLLVLTIIFYTKDLNKVFNQKINLLLLLWIIIFLINILFNLINVYNLNNYPAVQQVCQLNLDFCHFTTMFFFKFKIFRFITLSSYFFTIPILLIFISKNNFLSRTSLKKFDILQKTTFIILFIVVFSNIIKGSQAIYLSIIHSYQVINENYYDRFTFKKGGVAYYGWIRVFSNFIIQETSEKITLLVPPQSDTYKMEGNINYFRWFLYPRNLTHLEDIKINSNKKIHYIVISAGECNNHNCVWPDYSIDKSKINQIILINRETQKIERLINQNYIPSNFYNKWGLIELK